MWLTAAACEYLVILLSKQSSFRFSHCCIVVVGKLISSSSTITVFYAQLTLQLDSVANFDFTRWISRGRRRRIIVDDACCCVLSLPPLGELLLPFSFQSQVTRRQDGGGGIHVLLLHTEHNKHGIRVLSAVYYSLECKPTP